METTLPEPTQDERTMAMLAHILQLFGGFIGPLIIYFVKRESRFVAFHSLQAVFWQLAWMVFFFCGIILAVLTALAVASGGSKNESPAVFGAFVLVWVGAMGFSMLNLVLAIYFAIRASQGKWAEYPLVARWARQVAGI